MTMRPEPTSGACAERTQVEWNVAMSGGDPGRQDEPRRRRISPALLVKVTASTWRGWTLDAEEIGDAVGAR